MPDAAWTTDSTGTGRFHPPAGVTLYVPVVVSLLVQVPPTIAIAVWTRHLAPWATAASILLATASALALLAARRFPGPTVAVITALAVADVFIPTWGPPYISLAFAIVGAVVRGARVWAFVSVGVGWLFAVVVGTLLRLDWHPLQVAAITAVLAACFGIGAFIRNRRDRAIAYRAQLAERRRTTEREERERIARELHDVLAHSLSQISVQAGMGLHLFDREPEKAREALANIRGLSATGLDEVRGVLAFLRGDERSPHTAPLTPQPQLADLERLADQRTGLGLTVTLDDRLDGDLPPSSVQTTAYRIAQEALTNVVRHSAASTATITLDRDGDDLVVTVSDDGVGMQNATEGTGIRGIRERAALLDGTARLTEGSRGGTTVTARLPWNGPA
ncbi:sensor histidine kinase [Microbacterium sp. ASV49]|uniref:histidine kinase n=1 Tax=Microbacterium candidum TaxID=3041922 RepID=A0ABT7N443_9MICO|nr:sensor histidine kinase [Microbacterium sp. ASV49]MDL9981450.1 sensor histidine kinase [Microbacterium sp. ASV49]